MQSPTTLFPENYLRFFLRVYKELSLLRSVLGKKWGFLRRKETTPGHLLVFMEEQHSPFSNSVGKHPSCEWFLLPTVWDSRILTPVGGSAKSEPAWKWVWNDMKLNRQFVFEFIKQNVSPFEKSWSFHIHIDDIWHPYIFPNTVLWGIFRLSTWFIFYTAPIREWTGSVPARANR